MKFDIFFLVFNLRKINYKKLRNLRAANGVLEGEPCVLFYIPEGGKTESPTTYMSITNKKYYSVEFAEMNEKNKTSKVAPVAVKASSPPAPVEVKVSSPPASATAPSNDLYEQVKNQAELVRTVKANKASKVHSF